MSLWFSRQTLALQVLISTDRVSLGVPRDGVDDLLAGYQPPTSGEVVPRPAHLGHGGEAELVEVVKDVMVKVWRHNPQATNVQPLCCSRLEMDGYGVCVYSPSYNWTTEPVGMQQLEQRLLLLQRRPENIIVNIGHTDSDGPLCRLDLYQF